MKDILKLLRQIVLIVIFMAIAILLSQVILYDYASNDKTVSEPAKYEREEKVKTALSTNIDQSQDGTSIEFPNDVEITNAGKYEITNTDLNNYEKTNEYNPGKVNPFSSYKIQTSTDNNNNSSDGNNQSGKEENNNNSSSNPQNGNSSTKNPGLTK